MSIRKEFSRVVVGVDGSPSSKAALEFAAEEAKLRHAVLEIVHIWGLPTMAYGGYVSQLDDFEKDGVKFLDEITTKAKESYPDITIESTIRQGPPAVALIERGNNADLVVVGSRGHGGFTGLMLGSVSQQLAHHANFPLVIVRNAKN
ncbi:universal stress protein [Acidithrix sp. C25]|uniref:universal stress protein n=1 Tax=Acidithrix sp. C25 TaxID=1671482 RepID=UPI00191BC794|nr:universal stress protein [Acidithrix sp. C25]CAG4926026.1 unnamed protein product [Acidithrix sp. C25]